MPYDLDGGTPIRAPSQQAASTENDLLPALNFKPSLSAIDVHDTR